jgi:hypothetical protein
MKVLNVQQFRNDMNIISEIALRYASQLEKGDTLKSKAYKSEKELHITLEIFTYNRIFSIAVAGLFQTLKTFYSFSFVEKECASDIQIQMIRDKVILHRANADTPELIEDMKKAVEMEYIPYLTTFDTEMLLQLIEYFYTFLCFAVEEFQTKSDNQVLKTETNG